jgi:hypothetical protein
MRFEVPVIVNQSTLRGALKFWAKVDFEKLHIPLFHSESDVIMLTSEEELITGRYEVMAQTDCSSSSSPWRATHARRTAETSG